MFFKKIDERIKVIFIIILLLFTSLFANSGADFLKTAEIVFLDGFPSAFCILAYVQSASRIAKIHNSKSLASGV